MGRRRFLIVDITTGVRQVSFDQEARVGDHLALDFLNTIAAPKGTPIEWIGSGRELVNWLVGAGALDRRSAERLTAKCPLVRLDRVAQDGIQLREWFRALIHS